MTIEPHQRNVTYRPGLYRPSRNERRPSRSKDKDEEEDEDEE